MWQLPLRQLTTPRGTRHKVAFTGADMVTFFQSFLKKSTSESDVAVVVRGGGCGLWWHPVVLRTSLTGTAHTANALARAL